jgi:hypothetical protein
MAAVILTQEQQLLPVLLTEEEDGKVFLFSFVILANTAG